MARDATPRDLETPQPGFYQVRLVRGGHPLPAQITHDAESDTWAIQIGDDTPTSVVGNPWDHPQMERVYYYGRAISEDEHAGLLRLIAWARANDPDHPILTPTIKRALINMPPLF